MPRNFIKRAEIIYPIENTELKNRIINEILMTYLSDNVKARVMQPDGSYVRLTKKGRDPCTQPERPYSHCPGAAGSSSSI